MRLSRSLVSGRLTSGLLGPPLSPSLRSGGDGIGRVILSSPRTIIFQSLLALPAQSTFSVETDSADPKTIILFHAWDGNYEHFANLSIPSGFLSPKVPPHGSTGT